MGQSKTNRNLDYNNYWPRQLKNTLNILIDVNENVQMTGTQREFVKFNSFIAPNYFP